MQRDLPLMASVSGYRRNGRHADHFDLDVGFIGLPEAQRQRLRTEIIRGRFLSDHIHLN